MENIDERLSTLSAKRQKQFQRILEKELGTDFPEAGRVAQRIKEKTRAKILRYLGNEHQEKIEGRKHGSKGRKHRERGVKRTKDIESRLCKNGIDYALMMSELFDVLLKAKHSYKGIRYIGLCPFHDENTPSLSIAPDKGVIKCFGCGKGHHPEYLLMNVLDINYARALGMLEKYIYTPEQAKKWREENERIKSFYKMTPEQEEKERFVSSLSLRNVPYLSKKEFNKEFSERKKNNSRPPDNEISSDSHDTEDQDSTDNIMDDLPF